MSNNIEVEELLTRVGQSAFGLDGVVPLNHQNPSVPIIKVTRLGSFWQEKVPIEI